MTTYPGTRKAVICRSLAICGVLLVAGCQGPSAATTYEEARAKFAAGQWAECVLRCTDAISQKPDDIRAYVLRGRAYCRLGQFEPAITDFSIAIKLNPNNPEYYYLRADAHKDRGDIELADADNKAGHAHDPSYQSAYLYAPRDARDTLTPTAAELSRKVNELGRDASDDALDVLSQSRRNAPRPGKASPPSTNC